MPKYLAPMASCLLLLFASLCTQAQEKVEAKPPPPASGGAVSASQKQAPAAPVEPFIFETLQSRYRFETDGSGSRELLGRILIQSESALRDFGLLIFPYQNSSETLEITYVRVRKKDGTVASTPLTDVQDLDSEVSRSAPMYTDQREKHVAVKSLAVGDTLEYEVRWAIVQPLAVGNFWLTYSFFRQGVIRDEQLAIDLPKDRPIKLSSSITPVVSDEGNRRHYLIRSSHLERDPEDQESAWQKLLRPTPSPDVQLSSFTSWEDVGKWYASLGGPQTKVTPEIQAKATELTQGKTTDSEKLHAIYDFVSTHFRYIGISLGAGRYTPHAAKEVLANQYGDCKDKHTLFEALLAASGIRSYPVLISTVYRASPDHPSPALFNHLITAVPQGDSFLFLDTTPEVAPYGLLSLAIRDKYALVISEQGSARLVKTSADTIFPNTQKFEMNASIDEKGTLDGKARLESRGDRELLQREAFLSTAQPQWQQLTQNISMSMGFAGTVSDVSAAQPQITTDPFWLAYSYHRPEFPDWTNHRIAMALPFMGLPVLTEKEVTSKKSLLLGPAEEISFSTKITLPKGYMPVLPGPVEIKRDFGEYTATYSFENGVLQGRRKLITRLREIPATERPAYVSFAKEVQEDEGRFIPVSGGVGASAAHSINPEAQRFLEQGRQVMLNGDPRSATSFLERAVELDPKWSDAWMMLGSARLAQRQNDSGIDAFRRAVSLDPANVRAYKVLGFALMSIHRDAQAVQVWRDLLKVSPEDRDAPSNLGNLLFAAEKYDEARPVYETAVERNPESASLHLQLGITYLRLGDEQKSLDFFQKAMKLQPGAEMLNSVAYELAETNHRLPEALEYANQAVQQTEEETSGVNLNSLDVTDFRRMSALAGEWDTLGWVKFRMGDFATAEKYLAAAWKLMQAEVIGEHLGEVYEKLGKKQQASHAYAMALAAMGVHGDAKFRQGLRVKAGLSAAEKASKNGMPLPEGDGTMLIALRTIAILKPDDLGKGYKSAEFAISLKKANTLEEAKFLSGDEGLRGATANIAAAKFDVEFPDDAPTQILRRAILSCSQLLKECTLVLYPVDDPQPVPRREF
jgi:tetratricopeptide (TPR) repeat protein/transglutaminase-like putative cysteine protease